MVLALAHEVEVGVVEFGWIVVYGGEWDVWGFEVGFGPCGVVGEEVDVGGVEVGEELLEGVLVVVEGEGAVGLVGVGGLASLGVSQQILTHDRGWSCLGACPEVQELNTPMPSITYLHGGAEVSRLCEMMETERSLFKR